MNTHVLRTPENKNHPLGQPVSQKSKQNDSELHYTDNRPETVAQRKLNEMTNDSQQTKQAVQLKATANNYSERKNQNMSEAVQLKPKWKTSKLEDRHQMSANKVRDAQITKRGFRKKTGRGIAKPQLRVGDPTPDSPVNIGAVNTTKGEALTSNPRMLARQVTSWKLAKKMNLGNIHAKERYAAGPGKNELFGVSEFFEGGKTLEDMAIGHPEQLTEIIQEPNVQKQLSDLQLFDFIAGQSDRHLGNIMIGPNNTVKGIDNDQAFPAENIRQNLRNNQVNSFKMADGAMRFNQKLIDQETANTVKGMTREDMREVFNKGSEGEEKLNDQEFEATMQRLELVKARIAKLEEENRLIGTEGGTQWGPETYRTALYKGAADDGGRFDKGRNIVWRTTKEIEKGKRLVEAEEQNREVRNKKKQRGGVQGLFG